MERTWDHGAARGRAGADRLEEARQLARWLDAAFTIPGTRITIGLDALIGLLPGLGDVVASLLGGWIVLLAQQAGAPPSVILRMGMNLAFDAVIGAVPIVGDVADVAFRANLRNAALLERWMAAPARARRSSRLTVALVLLGVVAVVAAVGFATWTLVVWAVGAMRG